MKRLSAFLAVALLARVAGAQEPAATPSEVSTPAAPVAPSVETVQEHAADAASELDTVATPGPAVDPAAPPADAPAPTAAPVDKTVTATPVAEEPKPVEPAATAVADKAVASSDEAAKKQDESTKKPWSVTLSWENSTGAATFISGVSCPQGSEAILRCTGNEDGSFARAANWGMSFLLNPSYKLHKYLTVAAKASLGIELVGTNQTGDSYVRQPLLGDVGLSASFGKLYTIPVADIGISASTAISLPTSLASQFATKRFTWSASTKLSRELPGGVSLTYGLSFRKHNHKYSSPVGNLEDAPLSFVPRKGGNEVVGEGLIATGGNNSSFGLSNTLSVEWSLPWVEGLSTSLSYAVHNGWYYRSFPQDEFTSPLARGGGRGMDLQDMSFDVSYTLPFFQYVTVSAGTAAAMVPVFTPDGHSYYFPWAAPLPSNAVGYYLSASATY